MTDHPITPPQGLVQQWMRVGNMDIAPFHLVQALVTQAARWGADTELEACCEVLAEKSFAGQATLLREWRRPKPPSLKKQALALLGKKDAPVMLGTPEYRLSESEADTIRRALEALDD